MRPSRSMMNVVGSESTLAVYLRNLLRADHHAVVDLFLCDVRLDGFPAILVERDAQHREVAYPYISAGNR